MGRKFLFLTTSSPEDDALDPLVLAVGIYGGIMKMRSAFLGSVSHAAETCCVFANGRWGGGRKNEQAVVNKSPTSLHPISPADYIKVKSP